jgi:hypothetical protein
MVCNSSTQHENCDYPSPHIQKSKGSGSKRDTFSLSPRIMVIMVFRRSAAGYLQGLTFPIAFPYVKWYTPMLIP